MEEIRIMKKLIDMMDNRIVIFGCGGHARSIVDVIRKTYDIKEIVLVDEDVETGEIILGCNTEQKHDLGEKEAFIVAVGDNGKRKKIYYELKEKQKGHCVSIVASSASIGTDVEIGKGTFVAANTYLGPSVKVGNNTIINTGSIIEHEVIIGDHSHIAVNAAVCGRTRIGNNVFCGAGSTIIDKISICDNVVIGAGAVVIEDIVESGTYVGIPAKRIH